MAGRVTYERKETIGIITVDNPPVNALGHDVRVGFVEALNEGLADRYVQALVLIGGGRTFPAGADISEFGKSLTEPDLRTVISNFEASSKPVIAAIHGTALGGGLELALGCHYRVALNTAQVGLPEVNLGILPGAGGTQRLPRLIGVEAALDMITTGKFVKAPNALELGIVDEVTESDLLEAAIAFAEKVIAEKMPLRKIRDLKADIKNKDVFDQYRNNFKKRSRGLIAPFKCINCVEYCITEDFDEGMISERERFAECLNSSQSKGQRHMFFSEREVAKIPDVPKDTPVRPIETVGVIGAGTMGGGIAMNFANVGIPVTIVEATQDALDRGLGIIEKNYANSVKKGRITQDAMDQCMGLIKGSLSYDDFANADMVIEAVFEEMELKKEIFTKLDAVCKDGAILASNTSTLDLDAIANCTKRPADVIGTHFFSPANVMKLLELVRGAETSKDVIATTMKVSKTIKKVGVLAGNCDGFIGNRMLFKYFDQAQFLLEEGALPQDVDKALYDFGFAMGPFAMSDLAGNDVSWRIRQRHKSEAPADAPYSGRAADLICEDGRYGQKTGAGWYDYEPGNRTPLQSDTVKDAILKASEEKGIKRRSIDDEEIFKRCIYALVNEGAKILEEGIALRAKDIDVVYVYGYGFPIYRGGPMFFADQMGLRNVLEDIRRFRDEGPHGSVWEPAPLLEKLVKEGKSFGDI